MTVITQARSMMIYQLFCVDATGFYLKNKPNSRKRDCGDSNYRCYCSCID